MKILFAHRHFPTQFRYLAEALANDGDNEIVAITSGTGGDPLHVAPVKKVKIRIVPYARHLNAGTVQLPHFLSAVSGDFAHGWAVYRAARALARDGFQPDIIYASAVWGESIFLKEVFPSAKLLVHLEQYHGHTLIDFDARIGPAVDLDERMSLLARNACLSWSAATMDWGVASTASQRDQFPPVFHPKISVIHEGINTQRAAPAKTVITIPNSGLKLGNTHEIVSFAARQLETMRGFESFLRAVPQILAARPNAQILIIGSEVVDILQQDLGEQTLAAHLRTSLGDGLDPNRVHFLGRLDYDNFLRVLQISSVHVYLSYPLMLSWSMLEAMACGCVLVGSRNAPVTDVIEDGKNGLLLDFFDIPAIAEAVIDILADPPRRSALAMAARETIVTQYDRHAICLPRQLNLIERLISSG